MRRIILFLSAAMFLTSSAGAADRYAFHLRATDGKTGLLANPDFESLALPPDRLEKAANDRVIVLDGATGTRWRWIMLSWFAGDPKIEQGVNERGGALPKDADFALAAGKAGHFRIRCLQDDCRVRTTNGDRSTDLRLGRGELSPDLAFDADLSFHFPRGR